MAGANAPPTGFVDDWTTVLEPFDRVQTATASFVPGLIATRGSVFALKSSAVRSTGAPKLPPAGRTDDSTTVLPFLVAGQTTTAFPWLSIATSASGPRKPKK